MRAERQKRRKCEGGGQGKHSQRLSLLVTVVSGEIDVKGNGYWLLTTINGSFAYHTAFPSATEGYPEASQIQPWKAAIISVQFHA